MRYRLRVRRCPTWLNSASASRLTCEVGGHAATVIGERAKDGAKKIYQIITEKKPDTTGSIGGEGEDQGAVAMARPDTLTQDDLAAEWQPPPLLPKRLIAADNYRKRRSLSALFVPI